MIIWRVSQNVHGDSKMEKKNPRQPARCTPSRSEANSHAERTLAGVTQCPIPTMHGIMSEPRDGWEQARADLTPVFSCPTGGIKEGSELPRVRMRGHRHKPTRGKFLLEVRKDFSPWGCSNVLRLFQKDCWVSLAFGRCKIGMGRAPSKLVCLHLLRAGGWIRGCPHVPFELNCSVILFCTSVDGHRKTLYQCIR